MNSRALISAGAELDLFGLPLAISNARQPGQPRHAPSSATRALAEDLAAKGRPQAEIAQAIGITIPTLHRHYHREIGSASQAWQKLADRKERNGNG